MAWTRAQLSETTITYTDSEQPQKKRLFASLLPVAYADAQGQLQPIDLTPQRVQVTGFNGWRVQSNSWHYGLETDGTVWFGGRHGQHFLKIRLARIGYTQLDKGEKPAFPDDFTDIGGAATYNTANLTHTALAQHAPDGPINNKTLAEWRDLWPALPQGEIYVRWALDGYRLKEEVVIDQSAREWIAANRAPGDLRLDPATSWLTLGYKLDISDIPRRYLGGLDVTTSEDIADSGTDIIEGRNAADELLFFLPIDDAYVIDDQQVRHTVRLHKRLWKNSDGQWWLIVGAKAGDLNALPAGDLVFDPTINASVGASADDRNAEGAYGAVDFSSLFIGRGIGPVTAGIRFRNIALSSADTVDSVALDVVPINSSWLVPKILFNFEDADNPGDFSSDYPEDRTVLATGGVAYEWNHQFTAGEVETWPPNTADQETLGTLLQQVIDRPGFAGDAIVLLDNHPGDPNIGGAGSYGYQVGSYDTGTYPPAALRINYTAGTGGGVSVDLSTAPSQTDMSVQEPTAVAGSLSLTPAAGGTGLTIITPEAVYGSLNLALDPVSGAWTGVDPTAVAGSLNLPLFFASSGWTTTLPTVLEGSLNLSLAAAAVGLAAADPSTLITGGGVSVTPSAAAVGWSAVSPITTLGNLSLVLSPASSGLSAVAPTVNITGGGVAVSLAAAASGWRAIVPVVVQSSLSLNLGTAAEGLTTSGPIVSAGGSLTLTLAPSSLILATGGPQSVLGSVQVLTIAASVETAVNAPEVLYGSVLVAPVAVKAGLGVQAPNVGLSALSVALAASALGLTVDSGIVLIASSIRTNPRTTVATGIRSLLAANAALVAALTEDGMFKVFLGAAPGLVNPPYVVINHVYGGQMYRTPRPELDTLWSVRAVSASQTEAEEIHRLLYYALTEARPAFADGWYADQDIIYNGPHNDIDTAQGVQYWAFGGYYRIRAVKNRY